MKFSLQQLTFAALTVIPQANGHCKLPSSHFPKNKTDKIDGFPYTVYEGVVSKRWEYVRASTTSVFQPNYDYSGIAAMCGDAGQLPLFPVKTLKVAAGSTIGFGAARQTGRSDSDESKDFRDVRLSISHLILVKKGLPKTSIKG